MKTIDLYINYFLNLLFNIQCAFRCAFATVGNLRSSDSMILSNCTWSIACHAVSTHWLKQEILASFIVNPIDLGIVYVLVLREASKRSRSGLNQVIVEANPSVRFCVSRQSFVLLPSSELKLYLNGNRVCRRKWAKSLLARRLGMNSECIHYVGRLDLSLFQ